jgi:hypothetical protein
MLQGRERNYSSSFVAEQKRAVPFGHEETIADQAESEADEDLRRMSKSSG